MFQNAIWMWHLLTERNRTKAAWAEVQRLKAKITDMYETLGSSNDWLLVAKAERTAYEKLTAELLLEIEGHKPANLTKRGANQDRLRFLNRVYKDAIFELERKQYIKYLDFGHNIASIMRNNYSRNKFNGQLSKMKFTKDNT